MIATQFLAFLGSNHLKKLFSMRYGKLAAYFLGSLLGWPIAFFAPLNVLTDFPLLAEFVRFFEVHIGFIGVAAKFSDFPEVTKLFYSFQFSLIPLWFYCLLLVPFEKSFDLSKIREIRYIAPLILVYTFALAYLVLILGISGSSGANRGILAITQISRLGLVIVGPMPIFFAFVLCPYFTLILFVKFREIYLK